MKVTLIVSDKDGKAIMREWSPQNQRDIERRKEFIGRMLNEIEQELGMVISVEKMEVPKKLCKHCELLKDMHHALTLDCPMYAATPVEKFLLTKWEPEE